MSRTLPRTAAVAAVLCAGVAGQLLLAGAAGAVTGTKVELKAGQLRLEGTAAPGQFVFVESTTSTAGARAGIDGVYKVQATGFTAPDCRLTVRDGRTATATLTIPGCTSSVVPVPAAPAPPNGNCVIDAVPATTLTAGVDAVVNFSTTGCDRSSVLRWSVVAGGIPTGMTGPTYQGPTGGNLIGVPGVRGTYAFTLQAVDPLGATDQENVTVTVV